MSTETLHIAVETPANAKVGKGETSKGLAAPEQIGEACIKPTIMFGDKPAKGLVNSLGTAAKGLKSAGIHRNLALANTAAHAELRDTLLATIKAKSNDEKYMRKGVYTSGDDKGKECTYDLIKVYNMPSGISTREFTSREELDDVELQPIALNVA